MGSAPAASSSGAAMPRLKPIALTLVTAVRPVVDVSRRSTAETAALTAPKGADWSQRSV